MDFKKFGRLLMMASVMGLAASCTLDEPKGLDDNDSGSNLLKEITMYGFATALSIDYDDQGRVTTINAPFSDYYLAVNYVNGRPDNIVMRDDSDETTVSDLVFNSNGYLISCTNTDAYDPEVITMKFEYDSEGHLLRQYENGALTLVFTWENGLLMAIDEIDPFDYNHTSHYKYTYTDITNEHKQWSPFWYGTFGPVNLTGFFGVAPSKFIASATDQYDTERYDYVLNSRGYIRAERSLVEGEIITLNYKY